MTGIEICGGLFIMVPESKSARCLEACSCIIIEAGFWLLAWFCVHAGDALAFYNRTEHVLFKVEI